MSCRSFTVPDLSSKTRQLTFLVRTPDPHVTLHGPNDDATNLTINYKKNNKWRHSLRYSLALSLNFPYTNSYDTFIVRVMCISLWAEIRSIFSVCSSEYIFRLPRFITRILAFHWLPWLPDFLRFFPDSPNSWFFLISQLPDFMTSRFFPLPELPYFPYLPQWRSEGPAGPATAGGPRDWRGPPGPARKK